MDISKLPLNGERATIQDTLAKSRRDFEQLARGTLAEAVLKADAEVIRKRTLALCYVIYTNLTGPNASLANETDSFSWLRNFVDACDENEIRWCDELLEKISRILADVCVSRGPQTCAENAGILLIALCKRLSGNWTELCSIHTDLLQVCLVAKMYPLAVQVAEVPAVSVSSRKDSSKLPKTLPQDLLRYFYYSGVAFCAMRRFSDALHAFAQCLSFPARAYGAIQEEAYKKYVLVSLIVKGKRVPLPKYAPQAVVKSVSPDKQGMEKNVISASVELFHEIADAFAKQDKAEELQKALRGTKTVAELTSSGNLGLISHVLDAYWKNRIVQLTGTYVTLSLQDIAAAVNTPVDRTETQLLMMIKNREVRARLDQRSGMVRFLSESEDVEEQSKAVAKIEAELQRVSEFAGEVRAQDKRLTTSKDYVRKLTLRGSDSARAFALRGSDSADVNMSE